MLPDPASFARLLTAETGLPLTGKRVRSGDQEEIELTLAGYQASETFRLRASLRWRSVVALFEPGAYAAPLANAMKNGSPEARAVCESVIAASQADGAEVRVTVGTSTSSGSIQSLWTSDGTHFTVQLSRGPLDVNAGNLENDTAQLVKWTARLAAAMVALMPVGSEDQLADESFEGYPEGATVRVTASRYERDRRNRAAAIAIHGVRCRGCGLDFGERYGTLARGFIEIHHVTPVSRIGGGYIIDPARDLVPLCSNCHSVVHRQDPPLTIDDLQRVLREASSTKP